MIIQILLTIGLLSCLLYGLVARNDAPLIGVTMTLACLIGGYFIWFPSHATMLANFLDVGRGADLVLYCWVIISMSILINIHVRLRSQSILFTELARKIALQAPQLPEE